MPNNSWLTVSTSLNTFRKNARRETTSWLLVAISHSNSVALGMRMNLKSNLTKYSLMKIKDRKMLEMPTLSRTLLRVKREQHGKQNGGRSIPGLRFQSGNWIRLGLKPRQER